MGLEELAGTGQGQLHSWGMSGHMRPQPRTPRPGTITCFSEHQAEQRFVSRLACVRVHVRVHPCLLRALLHTPLGAVSSGSPPCKVLCSSECPRPVSAFAAVAW